MTNPNEKIQPVLDDIYRYEGLIGLTVDKNKFEPLLRTEVNGGILLAHFVLATDLGKNGTGLLIYILTDVKFLELGIDKVEFKFSSAYLNQFVGVSKTILNKPNQENDAQVIVQFSKSSFGLRYSASNQEVEKFFIKLDEIAGKK